MPISAPISKTFSEDESSYSVRAFGNARELFESCEESLPDIVLLDMKMGDASGDKVLEQLITRWPGLCVIIITGYPSLEDMRTTFKLKVFDYLAKPFSLTQLRQVLKNAVVAFGLGKIAAGPPARTPGAFDQNAARGTRLVTEGSGDADQTQRVADQCYRTRDELA